MRDPPHVALMALALLLPKVALHSPGPSIPHWPSTHPMRPGRTAARRYNGPGCICLRPHLVSRTEDRSASSMADVHVIFAPGGANKTEKRVIICSGEIEA